MKVFLCEQETWCPTRDKTLETKHIVIRSKSKCSIKSFLRLREKPVCRIDNKIELNSITTNPNSKFYFVVFSFYTNKYLLHGYSFSEKCHSAHTWHESYIFVQAQTEKMFLYRGRAYTHTCTKVTYDPCLIVPMNHLNMAYWRL